MSYGISGLIDAKEAVKLSPASVGSETREAKFIGGSCARHHCFLVDDQGDVWGCGNNMSGQLGLVSTSFWFMPFGTDSSKPVSAMVTRFTRINGPWTKDAEKVIAVSTGNMFSLFLTDAGYVYSAGSGEFGQLGHGSTGIYLFTCPLPVCQAE